MNEVAAFLGILVGALCQTLYQFLMKVASTPEGAFIRFDVRYVATMVTSVILAFVGALALFMLYQVPAGVSVLYVFAGAFGEGFTVNVVVNVGYNAYLNVKR